MQLPLPDAFQQKLEIALVPRHGSRAFPVEKSFGPEV